MAISQALIRKIRAHYRLDWHGIHGVSHWARVRDIGLKLAHQTGANPQVVELFAFLHDSQRFDDYEDLHHGLRAAEFARELHRQSIIQLPDNELELLCDACEYHSHGGTEANITILTCWDADRLDLGRCFIVPRPDRLCTEAAKTPAMIEWAYKRSLAV